MKFLPNDVYLFILSFVTYKDKIKALSICKEVYHEGMKKVRSIAIMRSLPQFLTNKEYQQQIAQKILSPFQQLEILGTTNKSILSSLTNIIEPSFFPEIARLVTNDEDYYHLFQRLFPKISNLFLTSHHKNQTQVEEGPFIRLDRLSNVTTHLHITYFHDVEIIEGFSPFLEHLEIVECRSLQQLHFHPFQNLQKLIIMSCPLMMDVSCFGDIPYLGFVSCEGIKDISSLQNNQRINIVDCLNIRDYSHSFLNSEEISLEWFHEKAIIEFGAFKKMKSLSLICYSDGCDPFPFNDTPLPESLVYFYLSNYQLEMNLTPFQYCQEVQLRTCDNITSVAPLGIVKKVVLDHLYKLQSLEGLGRGNQSVRVLSCNQIKDFSPLRDVTRVEIVNCFLFHHPEDVCNVQYLTIEGANFNDVRILGKVQCLRLKCCPHITSVEGLELIPTLELTSCISILTYEHLQFNKTLTIQSWKKLNELRGLEVLKSVYSNTKRLHQKKIVFFNS